jgi:hypothetical protein
MQMKLLEKVEELTFCIEVGLWFIMYDVWKFVVGL